MTRIAAALLLLLLVASPALAFDPTETFKKGSTVLSIEGGGGSQSNLQNQRRQTELDLW
jgi:hypothetical protein